MVGSENKKIEKLGIIDWVLILLGQLLQSSFVIYGVTIICLYIQSLRTNIH